MIVVLDREVAMGMVMVVVVTISSLLLLLLLGLVVGIARHEGPGLAILKADAHGDECGRMVNEVARVAWKEREGNGCEMVQFEIL